MAEIVMQRQARIAAESECTRQLAQSIQKGIEREKKKKAAMESRKKIKID